MWSCVIMGKRPWVHGWHTGIHWLSSGRWWVDQARAVSQMVACVRAVNDCLAGNMLKNSIDKLVCMCLHSFRMINPPKLLPLIFGDTTIGISPSARNHGVIFDQHLTLEQQVIESSRKAFYQLRCVARVRKFIDNTTCNSLVCSLVFHHLGYCNSLMCGVPKLTLDRLQRVQNATLKFFVNIVRDINTLALFTKSYTSYQSARESSSRLIRWLTNALTTWHLVTYRNIIPYQPGRTLRNSNQLLIEQVTPALVCYGGRSFANAANDAQSFGLGMSFEWSTFLA